MWYCVLAGVAGGEGSALAVVQPMLCSPASNSVGVFIASLGLWNCGYAVLIGSAQGDQPLSSCKTALEALCDVASVYVVL